MEKIILKHLTAPLSEVQITEIRHSQKLSSPKECLGGQKAGFFFFTTNEGIEAQKKFSFDNDTPEQGKCRYIVQAQANLSDIRYPTWKLDTEAFSEILFNVFRKEAIQKPIVFDDIKVSSNGLSLNVENGTSFHRYKKLTGNESGLTEKIADFLYQTCPNFKNFYNDLLQKTALGEKIEIDRGLYALKTKECPTITHIEPVHKNEPEKQAEISSSRLASFYKRYGRM